MRLLICLLALSASARLNVLFIAIDDLRPVLGCYDDPVAVTPHIDALANRGTVFNRAYCQQAVCAPSRLSLLSGRRPDSIRVWDLGTHFRKAVPDCVTLPQHFKNSGYHTQSIGKIYHGGGVASKDPPSWSAPPMFDYVRDPKLRYAAPENLKGKGLKRAAAESANVDDGHYIDGKVCEAGLKALRTLSTEDQPFFLALGFRKPHLPFCAPTRYWDLYDREAIPMPQHPAHPEGAPELATRSWKELEGYTDIPGNGQITAAKMRELRHGYYACVSYVDALVGRTLEELKRLGLAEKTVVVIWGDHGFHLGEQGLWTKANNYELSTRVPLIVSVPGQKPGRTDALVELLDIYPSLVEICELPAADGLEGRSFAPLLTDPDQPWKQAAFSQFPRHRTSNRHRAHGDIMGYSLRTKRFHYVQWRHWKTREIVAEELYDHAHAPHENRNLIDAPEHAGERAKLTKAMWKAFP